MNYKISEHKMRYWIDRHGLGVRDMQRAVGAMWRGFLAPALVVAAGIVMASPFAWMIGSALGATWR